MELVEHRLRLSAEMAVIWPPPGQTFCTSSSVSCCKIAALACSPSTTMQHGRLSQLCFASRFPVRLGGGVQDHGEPRAKRLPFLLADPGAQDLDADIRVVWIFSRRCLASTSAVLVMTGASFSASSALASIFCCKASRSASLASQLIFRVGRCRPPPGRARRRPRSARRRGATVRLAARSAPANPAERSGATTAQD